MLELISLFKLDKEEGNLKDGDGSVVKNTALRTPIVPTPGPSHGAADVNSSGSKSSGVAFGLTSQKRFMVGIFDFCTTQNLLKTLSVNDFLDVKLKWVFLGKSPFCYSVYVLPVTLWGKRGTLLSPPSLSMVRLDGSETVRTGSLGRAPVALPA